MSILHAATAPINGRGKAATVDFAVIFSEEMGPLFRTWRPPSAGTAIGAVNFCLPQVSMTLITSREHIACDYSTYLGRGKAATVHFAVIFSEEMGPLFGTWRPPSAGIAIGAVNFCLPQVPMTLITSREHIACGYSTYKRSREGRNR